MARTHAGMPNTDLVLKWFHAGMLKCLYVRYRAQPWAPLPGVLSAGAAGGDAGAVWQQGAAGAVTAMLDCWIQDLFRDAGWTAWCCRKQLWQCPPGVSGDQLVSNALTR